MTSNHIIDVIELFKALNLEDYLTPAVLKRSIKQIKALVMYCNVNNIPLINKGKLNSLFKIVPSRLKKRYGIDVKLLIEEYKLELI